jgi:Xaa-Pro aminopeptidase
MMQSPLARVLAVGLLLVVSQDLAHAQVTTPDPPVRYDSDHLSADFHRSRRALVLEALPQNAVAVFFSAPEARRGSGGELPYQQDNDLYYLTGSTEAETVLLLAPGGVQVDGQTAREVLFVPERTSYSDVWDGRRFGSERAEQELGLEHAVSNERFAEVIRQTAVQPEVTFFHLPLPDGYRRGSQLATQVGVFTEVASPIERAVHPELLRAVAIARMADDAATLQRAQRALRGRLAELPTDMPGMDILQAFVSAPDIKWWSDWQTQNLADHADGTTLRGLVNRLRMIKTDEELALLRRAIDITSMAHREAMSAMRPGMHEYEVQAVIEYVFMREGAERPGFNSIVGSGENSVILHYSTNRRQMEDGDVVVVDIGAEYRGYVADVTRTYPVNGRFSDEQRAIYELVLQAQQAGIEAAQVGAPFGAPGQAATVVIAEGLQRLGLIDRPEQVRRFFMHGTSHYLGLAVHDVGDFGPLQAGQAITVEPGIYIRPAEDIDPRWWNIGVRIEDDILIRPEGPELLSTSPWSVSEIEALMGGG